MNPPALHVSRLLPSASAGQMQPQAVGCNTVLAF